MEPSTNGDNGRDDRGRFAEGNRGGPGNPHAKRVAKLRSALLDAVTEDDLQAIIAALVRKAKGGDIMAAKILLDRVLGKPLEADIIERLERLEKLEQEQQRRHQ